MTASSARNENAVVMKNKKMLVKYESSRLSCVGISVDSDSVLRLTDPPSGTRGPTHVNAKRMRK